MVKPEEVIKVQKRSEAETSKAVHNGMDSEPSLRCELCEHWAEENGRLIQERDFSKEIIVQFRKDIEESKSDRNEVQEKDPNQWVDMPTRSDKCEKPRRKSVVELRNRFEVLSVVEMIVKTVLEMRRVAIWVEVLQERWNQRRKGKFCWCLVVRVGTVAKF